MSISNLLVPNDLDIFANAITVNFLNAGEVTINDLALNTLAVNTITSNPSGGTVTLQTDQFDSTGRIIMPNNIQNRKIVLFPGTTGGDDNQFYGFGINSNILRYQVLAPSADHVFYTGAGVGVSTELLRIKGTGGGIVFPSVGATTPAQLNYYETVNIAFVFSGIWTSFQNQTLNFTRIGNTVTVQALGSILASVSGAGPIIANSPIPARFRPTTPTNISIPIVVLNNSIDSFGTFLVTNTGNITIANGAYNVSGGTFTVSGNGGFYPFSVCYTIS